MRMLLTAVALLFMVSGCASVQSSTENAGKAGLLKGSNKTFVTLDTTVEEFVELLYGPPDKTKFLGIFAVPTSQTIRRRASAEKALAKLKIRILQERQRLSFTGPEPLTSGSPVPREQLLGDKSAAESFGYSTLPGHQDSGLTQHGFLGPVTPNAYGPGINSDGTGRAFIWKPDYGSLPPLGPITPNAYGPGVGMDATGMPVRPSCPPGQVMC